VNKRGDDKILVEGKREDSSVVVMAGLIYS